MTSPPRPPAWPLLAAFVALVVGLWIAAESGSDWGARALDMRRWQFGLALASAGWVLALGRARGLAAGRSSLAVVFGGAVLLRVLAAQGAPGLSDDVHRYVFEGGLVAAGVSPYAAAPSAPQRAAQRADWPGVYARLNHPEVSAAYPPCMQYLCAGVVSLAGGPAAGDGWRAVGALRLAFTLADLGVLVLLLRAGSRAGQAPARALAWGWSPLVVTAFAGDGHFDSLGILGLVAGLTLASAGGGRRRGELAAGFALAAGTLVKLLPVVALPWVARRAQGGGARRVLVAFGLGGVLGVAPLAALEGGFDGLLRGLSEYALRWEATSLVYRFVEAPLRAVFALDESWHDPRRLGRALVLLVLVLLAAIVWRKVRDPRRAAFLLLTAVLVLSPTVHPWYLVWLAPFLVWFRSLAVTWLLAAAPLLYWPVARWQAEGVWVEPGWLWPLVALPFAALALVDTLRARRPRSEPRPA